MKTTNTLHFGIFYTDDYAILTWHEITLWKLFLNVLMHFTIMAHEVYAAIFIHCT